MNAQKMKKAVLAAVMLLLALALAACAAPKDTKQLPAEATATPAVDHASAYAQGRGLLAEGRYEEAAEVFANTADYEQTATYLQYIDAAQLERKGSYTEAADAYRALEGFLDSNVRASDCDQKALSAAYNDGEALIRSGSYAAAVSALLPIDGYQDVSQLLMYARSLDMAQRGEYDMAISSLDALGDYRDSRLQALYVRAQQAEANEAWAEASNDYRAIAAFRNSADRLDDLADKELDREFSAAAATLGEHGWNTAAQSLFIVLLNKKYTTSDTLMFEKVYALAEEHLNAGRTTEARNLFGLLRDREFGDSAERLKDCLYADARAAMDAGDYDGAAAMLKQLPDYPAAAEALRECATYQADAAYAAGDYATAYALYSESGITDKAAAIQQAYNSALTLLAEGHYEEANTAFAALNNYADAQRMAREALYRKAQAAVNAGEYDSAVSQFEALGDYSDSAMQVNATRYREAVALMADGQWDAASAAFAAAGNYSNAAERVLEPYYQQGMRLLSTGDEIGAFSAFSKAGSFGDAQEQVKGIYYAQATRYAATGEWDKAIENYQKAGDYADAAVQAEMAAARRNGTWTEPEPTAQPAPAAADPTEVPATETAPEADPAAATPADLEPEIPEVKAVEADISRTEEGAYTLTFSWKGRAVRVSVIRMEDGALEGLDIVLDTADEAERRCMSEDFILQFIGKKAPFVLRTPEQEENVPGERIEPVAEAEALCAELVVAVNRLCGDALN